MRATAQRAASRALCAVEPRDSTVTVPPRALHAACAATLLQASRGAAAAQTANEPAGGVGDGRAMAGGDEGEGRGGGMAVGCPSGRASIGVVVMVFFFFAPLVGLFALSTLSERAQRAPPPFWCVAVPEGDVDSASGMVPSALAYANRSSGLQVKSRPADGRAHRARHARRRPPRARPWAQLSLIHI